MQTALVKTAHNPLIYEVQDFGLVVTNRFGQMIAEGSGLPGFLACLPPTIQSGLAKVRFADGDILLSNEPDDTGTHISDTVLYLPVFYRGELVAFTAVMAHWADIGGITPGGWCPSSISLHQEGLIFSHNKLYSGGVVNDELMRFILRNVRFPKLVEGDLNAMISACETGARRYAALCDRYGVETVEQAMIETFAHSESRMRREIAAIPDGSYSAEAKIDHDGVEPGKPHHLQVTVTVEGDEMSIDWTGTGPVARGPINHPLVGTAALCATTLKSLTMPFDATNDGHLRPLTVTAPPDTLVSAGYPAPCDSYGYVAEVIVHLIVRALAQVIPDRCPAATYQMCAYTLSREGRDPFICGEPVDGGGGAFPHDDGPSGIMFAGNGDAPNTPVEVIESRYPLRVLRYTFNLENRGVGKYRGGFGVVRDLEILEDGISLQTSTENNLNPLWGLVGGGDAGVTRILINAGTDREVILDDRVTNYPVGRGDTVSLRSANGGGWGDPRERDLSRIVQDVRNGFLELEQAAEQVGVNAAELQERLVETNSREREIA
jgi:N-methylhydantoinase B